jgi:hypothetical protein
MPKVRHLRLPLYGLPEQDTIATAFAPFLGVGNEAGNQISTLYLRIDHSLTMEAVLHVVAQACPQVSVLYISKYRKKKFQPREQFEHGSYCVGAADVSR